jgi:RNA polymerase sigma-70 factor (ECF subfamily)
MSPLQDAYEKCRSRFPTIDLPVADYQKRIEEVLAADRALRLEDLHHEDLFLALACAQGNRIAWEYFADEYLPSVQRISAQACKSTSEGEDLAQGLVAGLMENRAKLAGYSGRASLQTWLRVAISHAAIDRFRRSKREVALDEMAERGQDVPVSHVEDARTGNADPLDAGWGPVVLKILAEGIGRLTVRDRLLLSLYYLDDIPLKSIGRQFRVHEATASRHLDKIRKDLRKGVERKLRIEHRLSSREIRSILHWAREADSAVLREAFKD